jgi:hypothetical protein
MTAAREMQERCATLGIMAPNARDQMTEITEEFMRGWHAMGYAYRAAIRAIPCPAVASATVQPVDLGLEMTSEERAILAKDVWTDKRLLHDHDRLSAEVARLRRRVVEMELLYDGAVKSREESEAREDALTAVASAPAAAEVEEMAKLANELSHALKFSGIHIGNREAEFIAKDIAARLRRLSPSPAEEGIDCEA